MDIDEDPSAEWKKPDVKGISVTEDHVFVGIDKYNDLTGKNLTHADSLLKSQQHTQKQKEK